MEDYIKNKVIVITGGSSGFGLESARLLLSRGAKVIITGRNQDKLTQAEQDLAASDNLVSVQADACATEDWGKVISAATKAFKQIDVCVLNHGAGVEIIPTGEMSDETIDKILNINIASVIKGSREMVKAMKSKGKGQIVTVASACSYHSWPGWGAYTAAKAGLVAYTRCLHIEMSEWGGKAGCFIPGAAKTGFCDAANLDSDWQTGFPEAKDFARTLVHCIDVPDNCFIEEVNIWGTAQVPAMVNPF